MLWETKILASLTRNFPNQVGWMLNEGLDEKKPLWGLKMVPDFKQWYDDLNFRDHPGPKPLKKHYRNLPIPPARRKDSGISKSSRLVLLSNVRFVYENKFGKDTTV